MCLFVLAFIVAGTVLEGLRPDATPGTKGQPKSCESCSAVEYYTVPADTVIQYALTRN